MVLLILVSAYDYRLACPCIIYEALRGFLNSPWPLFSSRTGQFSFYLLFFDRNITNANIGTSTKKRALISTDDGSNDNELSLGTFLIKTGPLDCKHHHIIIVRRCFEIE